MHIITLEELLEPYQHYPKVIQTAILRVETHPSFSCLTRSMRRVLKALVTRISKNDGTTPIQARLRNVAAEADVSTKTVERAVALLKKIGWLNPLGGRNEYGEFCLRTYQFSPELCALVDIPAGKKLPRKTELSDGAVYVDLTFKKDQQEISAKTAKDKPVQLPPELQEITAYGIKDTGVAKLRGQAFEAGHNLADIFRCAKQHIERIQANGGRVFRYLQAMIGKNSDYAARASQIERMTGQQQEKAKARTRQEKYRHKRFVGLGATVRIFDDIADVTFDDGRFKNIAAQDMAEIYDAIEAGKLKEIVA